MDVEIVTIGTELLLGFTVDTNSAFAGTALAERGIRVVRRTAIADGEAGIRGAVAEALARTGVVITTGGLGPTRDDISKQVVAELFGVAIEFREGIWDRLVERYKRYERTPSPSNRTQAEMPVGALELPNRWGSAPGIWLEGARGLVIMLPGVPREMRNLLTEEVIPRLAERGGGAPIRSRTLRTTAIPESVLAERLGEVEEAIAPLTLAYLPEVTGVDLRVTAWGLPVAEAEERLSRAEEFIRARAGDHLYGTDGTDLAALVLDRARARGVRIALAESCTGGLLGARLTAIPGSSDVVEGGVVSYGNGAKVGILGVDPVLLAPGGPGAVSEEVARAMAEGAARRLGGTLTVGVTGIAGPGGGSAEKPVGTVWYATHFEGESRATRQVHFGERDEIRARAAQMALYLLWRRLS
jgi:nicotinamide-nucleotide amidase